MDKQKLLNRYLSKCKGIEICTASYPSADPTRWELFPLNDTHKGIRGA